MIRTGGTYRIVIDHGGTQQTFCDTSGDNMALAIINDALEVVREGGGITITWEPIGPPPLYQESGAPFKPKSAPVNLTDEMLPEPVEDAGPRNPDFEHEEMPLGMKEALADPSDEPCEVDQVRGTIPPVVMGEEWHEVTASEPEEYLTDEEVCGYPIGAFTCEKRKHHKGAHRV